MKTCHLKLSIRTKVLSPEETKAISDAVQLASPYEVAEAAMRISSLRNAMKNVFLKEVDKQCSNLCARKSAQPSVLLSLVNTTNLWWNFTGIISLQK